MTAIDALFLGLAAILFVALVLIVWRLSKAGVEVKLFGGIKVKVGGK